MSIHEPPNGDKVMCKRCGAAISSHDKYCAYCGAKQNIPVPAAAPENNWFSQAGNLAASTDGSHTPPRPNPAEAAPVIKTPVNPHPAGSEGAVTVRPKTDIHSASARPVPRAPSPAQYQRAPVVPAPPVKQQPRCRKCGSVVPKGTTLCWKCSSTGSIAEKTVAQTARAKPRAKKRSWGFLVIGIAVCTVLAIVILLLSMGGRLSEKEIIAALPNPITNIHIDDEYIQLHVDDLKIDRRTKKGSTDDMYCIIEMSSDTLDVTRYYQLTFEEGKGNEWELAWFMPYEVEEVHIRETSDELYDWAIERIEHTDSRYANIENYITNYDVTVDDREISYVFDIDKTIGLMHITGQIAFESVLDGDEFQDYGWRSWVDDDAIQISWDVDGTWKGGMSNFGMGWYELTLDVDTLDTKGIACTWVYDQDGKNLSGDGADCWIIKSDGETIEFCVGYGTALASYIKVTFYIDGTCVASIPALGDFYMDLQ